jgi:hypothetical protein
MLPLLPRLPRQIMSHRERTSRLRDEARRKFWSAFQGEMVCAHCGRKVSRSLEMNHPLKATVDHLTPLAANGSNELSNLTLACFRCNQLRGRITQWRLEMGDGNSETYNMFPDLRQYDWPCPKPADPESPYQLSFNFDPPAMSEPFAREKKLVAEALSRLRISKVRPLSRTLRSRENSKGWKEQTIQMAAQILAKRSGARAEEPLDVYLKKVKDYCASADDDRAPRSRFPLRRNNSRADSK